MKAGQSAGVFFLFAACVAAGYFGYGEIDRIIPTEIIPTKVETKVMEAEVTLPEEPAIDTPATPVIDTVAAPVIDAAAIPVIRSVSKPVYKNKTYSFNVNFYVATEDAVNLVLLNEKDEVLGNSLDGTFAEVLPSNTPYKVYAENLRTGQQSETYIVDGCTIPKAPLVDKVSAEKLTAMINRGDFPATFSKMWIREHAPHCKYVYTGLSKDDLKPYSLQDLCDRVNMESWKCQVTHIEYNDQNQIITATIHITK